MQEPFTISNGLSPYSSRISSSLLIFWNTSFLFTLCESTLYVQRQMALTPRFLNTYFFAKTVSANQHVGSQHQFWNNHKSQARKRSLKFLYLKFRMQVRNRAIGICRPRQSIILRYLSRQDLHHPTSETDEGGGAKSHVRNFQFCCCLTHDSVYSLCMHFVMCYKLFNCWSLLLVVVDSDRKKDLVFKVARKLNITTIIINFKFSFKMLVYTESVRCSTLIVNQYIRIYVSEYNSIPYLSGYFQWNIFIIISVVFISQVNSLAYSKVNQFVPNSWMSHKILFKEQHFKLRSQNAPVVSSVR